MNPPSAFLEAYYKVFQRLVDELQRAVGKRVVLPLPILRAFVMLGELYKVPVVKKAPAKKADPPRKKIMRGFAIVSPEKQREISTKGGYTISMNRQHMAEIGRLGGKKSRRTGKVLT